MVSVLPRLRTAVRAPTARCSARLALHSAQLEHVVTGAVCLATGGAGSFSTDTRSLEASSWYIALRVWPRGMHSDAFQR